MVFPVPRYSDPSKLAILRAPNPAIQVQTLPLEAPVILRGILFEVYPQFVEGKAMGFILSGLESPSLEKRMSNLT